MIDSKAQGRRQPGRDRRRGWAAAIVPLGVTEVFGGMFDLDQLYWTSGEAALGVEVHARARGWESIAWTQADDKLLIGRTHTSGDPAQAYVLLVRSVRLPIGSPPVGRQ